MIRINRNKHLISIHDLMFDINIVIGIGTNCEISTSKIINITAIRKNRYENSSRAEFFGSNPLSNGKLLLYFFRLLLLLLLLLFLWQWR